MALRKKKARQADGGDARRPKKKALQSKKRSGPSASPPLSLPESPGSSPREETVITKNVSEEPLARVEEKPVHLFPVVGIGASAGGVEAFTELLRHLPTNTGMAFIFVLHLSPVHKSVLTDILSRATRMPVIEIQEPTTIEPNHVFVIPPNANLSISYGVLHLLPREQAHEHLYMPIDFFFRALANDLSSRAIGIILSGTASDGALGLQAIKSEGGITFAQDERSAKYDGMPRAAIAAGSVDFVLPPGRIAAELARVGRHPYIHTLHTDRNLGTPAEEENDFNKVLILLRNASGVDFIHYKQSTIKRRILRRMLLQRINKQPDYLKFLQMHPAEVMNLYNDILINVTGFFRDAETFNALQDVVFPRIFKDYSARNPVRVWVPGCSTGEEAYSLAIALLEFLGDGAKRVHLQIFATDISDLALEKARAGIYPLTISKDVSQERLRQFFTELETGYQIRKSVRDICVFAKQNVYKDPPFSKLDLISCRNVLIYFGPVLHRKVIPIFYYALKQNGILVLGSSESIGGFSGMFSLIDKKFKFYLKKASTPHELIDARTAVEFDMKEVKPEMKPGMKSEMKVGYRRTSNIQEQVEQTLFSRYVPAGVVVDDDFEIVRVHGRTGAFLEPASGEATLNILKMVREGLLLDLRSALRKAKEEGKPARREGLVVKEDARTHRVNLQVIPLYDKETRARYYLVLFERAVPSLDAESTKKGKKAGRKERAIVDQRDFLRLKHELASAKEYLQSIIEEQEATNEELRSANEEIQSTNEELQSTNEELETAKEELQSANEELNTVNEALESRNSDLNQLNNDLVNLLGSVYIPIIIIGNDLRIRRFTPSAERVLNVISADVGRKITDIRSNLELPDLEEVISDVIENLRTVEREVRDTAGHWYAMRVRPYKTADNKIDGVVLVFFDINELKRIDDDRKILNELGSSLMEVVEDPVLVIDRSLRISRVNPAFVQVFNMPLEHAEGELFFDIHEHAWRTPEVQEFLQKVLAGGSNHGECHVHVDIPGVGPRDFVLLTRPITRVDGAADMILVIIKKEGEAAGAEKAQ